MKRRISLLLALAAVFLGGTAAVTAGAPPATSMPFAATAPLCSSSSVSAVIGGRRKCLHSGEYCARRYERQYRRYGFTCKIASDGRYRLYRR
jgi:hypothetical protein